MKIVLFVHNFPPEFLGGTEQVVLGLAKGLRELGEEVVIVSGSDAFHPGGRVLTERFEGFHVYRLLRDPEETYNLELDFGSVGDRIEAILDKEKPDAAHIHHWSTLGMGLVQRAKARGIPAIVSLHDLWTCCPRFFRTPRKGVRCPAGAERENCVRCISPDLGDPDPGALERRFERRQERLRRELLEAVAVLVPSQSLARRIQKHLPFDGPLEVLPHGLLQEPKERAVPRDKNLRVGCFGNLVPSKGLDLLVDALGHNASECEIHLAGHCPQEGYMDQLRERAKRHGLPLIWHGPFSAYDPHPALDLDLAVFPSLCEESYGLVVEEALARGVPVVVSARGALPERLENGGGVVVRSGGVMPLRIAVSNLIRNRKELDKLRAAIPKSFPTIMDAARRCQVLYKAGEPV
ncbi:MAG TPA: glycosyltransferase [Planctomycetes bacterium]|nr:glycosyltransferase [Planctomycetota bacterium]